MIKLFAFLKPYWKVALLAPLLMLVEVITDLYQPLLMASIIDQGIAQGDVSFIIQTGIKMIGIAVIGMVGGFGCTIAASIAAQSFGADLRTELFTRVQSFSFTNLDKFKSSSLITRLTNDVTQVQNIVLMSLRMMVRAPLLCIGGIIMTVRINPQLAAILLVAIPVLVIAMGFIIKAGYPLFSIVQQRLDRVNNVMQENLAGVRIIKAFVRGDQEKKRFAKANADLMEITMKASRLVALAMPLIMLIMNLSIVAVLWFGGIQVNAGTMQVGQVIAFINYMTQILFSLMMVALIFIMISRAKASADRICEVIETQVDIEDSPLATDFKPEAGHVVFDNVSFQYAEAQGDPVLKNISFSANPGETVAILGGTGSGKTTLVSLIPRLYDVTAGRILLDNQDIRHIKLQTLRQAVSIVLQDSRLFTGTIGDNIRWGDEEATDSELRQTAEMAQAHEFITKFQKGYNTMLGQRGVNVSGGQKQRISIARALLKRPCILILDDSTSAVDLGTEARIQQALQARKSNTTTFVIAQRITSVMHADKILVLDDGAIVASGTHQQLLNTSPIYQDIYQSQLGEEDVING